MPWPFYGWRKIEQKSSKTKKTQKKSMFFERTSFRTSLQWIDRKTFFNLFKTQQQRHNWSSSVDYLALKNDKNYRHIVGKKMMIYKPIWMWWVCRAPFSVHETCWAFVRHASKTSSSVAWSTDICTTPIDRLIRWWKMPATAMDAI